MIFFSAMVNAWSLLFDKMNGNLDPEEHVMNDDPLDKLAQDTYVTVSYTHLTLPTNREV